MASGEDFGAIVEQETEALRAKYRLSRGQCAARSVRYQNDKVFVEFWYDRDRNHIAEADVGLLKKSAELRDSYSATEIENFFGVERSLPPERDDRFEIRPQVRAIAAMLADKAERIFAGDVDAFVRLHYFSSGWSAHYTKTASTPARVVQTPKPSAGLYLLLALVFGVLIGVAAAYARVLVQLATGGGIL